jgi:rod shape-determining protein MreC
MRSFYIKSIIVFVAAGLLIFLVLFNSSWLANRYEFIREVRVGIFSGMSRFGSFTSGLNNLTNLTRENLSLKDENRKLLSQLAFQAELKNQNDFLRNIAGLDISPEYKFIDARTFNTEFTPLGHYLLINKGIGGGVTKDDIVITSSGVLIGRVDEVFEGFSRVELITNRDLKITVRMLDKAITAISRGALNDGLRLDFISQNDEVVNDDKVITNGNDLFPEGLMVGSVSRVSSNDGNLFKEVVVKPEFKNIAIDRVLILSR